MLWRALAYGRAIGPTCRIPVRGDRPGRRRVGDDSVRSGALVAITPRRTAERWAGGRRWKWNQKRPGAKQAPLYCGGGAGGSAACRPNGSAPKPKQAEVGWGHCGAMSRGDRRGRRAGEKGRMGRSARQIERGTRMGSAPQGHNMPVCVCGLCGVMSRGAGRAGRLQRPPPANQEEGRIFLQACSPMRRASLTRAR